MARKKRKDPPWTPFERVAVGPIAERVRAAGGGAGDPFNTPVEVHVNSRYQVAVHVYPPGTWESVEVEVKQLSIKRLDKREIKDWREFQMIKTAILGPNVEGIELYPSEGRLLDTANQYHIWCLPPGQAFPFGYFDGRIVADSSCNGGIEPSGSRQRPLPEGMKPTTTPQAIEAAIRGKPLSDPEVAAAHERGEEHDTLACEHCHAQRKVNHG